MRKDHIVKSYDQELAHLAEMISRMGGQAESLIEQAIRAFQGRDSELALMIVDADRKIDLLEAEVHEFTVRLLALRQPMAADLRHIVAAIRIAPDLERIGDYAKNMAKRTIALNQLPQVKAAFRIPRIARLVQRMLKDVLDAYAAGDIAKAHDVWLRDAEVDDLYDSMFRELLTYMMEDPRTIGSCIHLLFIARNIERMGDLATNIAETIHFSVTGSALEDTRPKRDGAALSVVAEKEAEKK
jgi:phosphate transport system protein